MKPFPYIARVLVLVVPVVALLPLARPALDWMEVAHVLDDTPVRPNGYDWAVWHDADGLITAAYVFPQGPADRAGIQAGDQFYAFEYQPLFDIEALHRAIEGVRAGEVRTYTVFRDGEPVEARIQFTRYPTFLYPLSTPLWRFALWGFTIGAFIHLLGLFIAAPLARRTAQARFSLLLILVSSLWMFCNLLRLVLVGFFAPPVAGTMADLVFQALTLIGLVGWIAFPVLLLHQVLYLIQGPSSTARWIQTAYLYLPALLLGGAALLTAITGPLGPLSLDGLLVPILFYASCYIATAAALMLLAQGSDREGGTEWSMTGSATILLVALLVALTVQGIVPILPTLNDILAGWLIVAAQLLSVAPIIMVSITTLKHGKVDQVVSRGVTYLTVYGLLFFAFVGGLALIEPLFERFGGSRNVVLGLYVVLLLILFERLARALRLYTAQFFASERQRKRQALARFQEQMRNLMDREVLLQQTVTIAGETFGARSASLFLCPDGPDGPWLSRTYHPEPPYLTQRIVGRVWPYMEAEGAIWARNPEVNESALPMPQAHLLEERGAALAVPVMGEQRPIGLLVLGERQARRAVYNLEDLDLLRTLCSQLALAVERLILVEREKHLARQSSEAQLVALRAQINPHFLFNALNTIAALIEERPSEAEATVENLAAIFRHILQTGSRPFVPLAAELNLVERYLDIEKARFEDKLQITLNIDPSLRQHPVPAFALQTLVENAIKHGLEPRRGEGTLRIDGVAEADGAAMLTVTDNGVGIAGGFASDVAAPEAVPAFFGIGLQNVAARLWHLYGRADLLRYKSLPGEGTTVTLRLPAERLEALPAPSS